MDLETRYELLDKIGTGSYATVYRARDNELGREVAIKEIHAQYMADPKQLNRYWAEAQLLASMQHPNIVPIYDIHRERGWLIMELMQANLAERMAGRPMDLRALRNTLAHALRALKFLHSRGIIHGDIKTSNLLISSQKRVKLGDFGLARRVSDEEGSLIKGTTKYMAPEVVDEAFGDVGPASDLYSLGFVAYELMCGPNFENLFPGLSAFGRNRQMAWMMWHAAPDRRLPEIGRVLEGVPEDLQHVIQKLCEKDQAKRYKTADEAIKDLKIDSKLHPHEDETVGLDTEGKPAEDPKRRWLLFGAVGVSLLLSLFMLFSGGSGTADPDKPPQVGFVKEIDPERGLIVWEDPEKGVPAEMTIPAGQKPEIYYNNEKEYILLRDIQPGDRIVWQTPEETGGGFKIQVSRPRSNQGRIIDYDLRTNTVTISLEDTERREDAIFRVPPRASIYLNGERMTKDREYRLGDLEVGDEVEVKFLDEIAGSGNVIEELRARRTSRQVGFISQVNLPEKKLKIRYGQGLTAGFLEKPLAEDCPILLHAAAKQQAGVAAPGEPSGGTPLPLEQLKEGDRVRYVSDDAIRRVEVYRNAKSVTGGVLNEINLQEQTVVVQPPTGSPLSFKINSSTDITVSHDVATLGELREQDSISLLYDVSATGEILTASTLDAWRPIRYERTAVIVAVQAYQDARISSLPVAYTSARKLQAALLSRYGMHESKVHLVLDPDRETLREQLQKHISSAGAPIQLMVYLCCQAYEDSSGTVWLAGVDYDLDQPEETGLSLNWLVQSLNAAAATDKMLMLDCSHAGKGKDLQQQPSSGAMLQNLQERPASAYAIASCDKGQKGQFLEKEHCTLFAATLAAGFFGPADRDRNLTISPQELWSFASDEMSRRPVNGVIQRPRLVGAN